MEISENPDTDGMILEFNHCSSGYNCGDSKAALTNPVLVQGTVYNCKPHTLLSEITGLLHSQLCNFSSECYNGKCESNKCNGESDGFNCGVDHKKCQVGSACINGQCSKQIALGGDCSNDAFQCVNQALCDNGKCIRYHSKAVGEEAQYALACESRLTQVKEGKRYCDNVSITKEMCEGEDEDVCEFTYEFTGVKENLENCSCNHDEDNTRKCVSPREKADFVEVDQDVHTLFREKHSIDVEYDSCIEDSLYGVTDSGFSIKYILSVWALLFTLMQ